MQKRRPQERKFEDAEDTIRRMPAGRGTDSRDSGHGCAINRAGDYSAGIAPLIGTKECSLLIVVKMEIMLVGFAELIGSIPAAFEELLKLLNFLLELFSFGACFAGL